MGAGAAAAAAADDDDDDAARDGCDGCLVKRRRAAHNEFFIHNISIMNFSFVISP